MSETPSQRKWTSARRKQYRQSTRAAAHKAYASENDATALEATRILDTPQTPNKVDIESNIANELSSTKAPSTKSRSKNKFKSKHGFTSPDFALIGGQTPPQRTLSIKPGTSTAFAGATFHASPAPSALPLPSFLSKSSTESPVPATKVFTQVSSPPTTDHNVPTPFRPASLPKTSESPLDFMFRAHREEKERHLRENAPGSYIPQMESPGAPPRFDVNEFSKSRSLPHSRRSNLRSQPGAIVATELDGTPGRPMGPPFSTPYQERIKAARSAMKPHSPYSHPQSEASLHDTQADDSTDALKKFLFGNPGPLYSNSMSSPSDSHLPPQTAAETANRVPRFNETRSVESRGSNIEAMENDLRRILKLDASSKSSSTDQIF